MSQWTHVNSSIRFDGTIHHDSFKPELGKPYLPYDDGDFESLDEPDGFIPTGSEGSLKFTVWETKSKSSSAGCTVNIFGDLRSYSNIEEILEYFKKITTGKMIRSGILEIDVEGNEAICFRYVNESWIKL